MVVLIGQAVAVMALSCCNHKSRANGYLPVFIRKPCLSKLAEGLLAVGVQKEDITDLTEAIRFEPTATKQYGPEVNMWMRKMMDKVLDGSWQIGLGAAGNVLAGMINCT